MNSNSINRPRWVILAAIVIASFYLFAGATTASAQSGISTVDAGLESLQSGAPVCRLGVNDARVFRGPGIPVEGIEVLDTAPLRLGWYIDYHADAAPARPQGANYAPMIRLKQTGPDSYKASPSGKALVNAVRANAGRKATWFIGNEIDRIKYQDDIMPDVYAKAFHELSAQIKAVDPSAKVIAGSIVQATELRMQYLDLILASHQDQYGEAMAVDGWATHGFVLREASCEAYPDDCWGAEIPPGIAATEGLLIEAQQNDDFGIFKANIVRMRQWMADNGYRNTPLYLSEYGVLMPDEWWFSPPFTPARVNTFMTRSFEYLLHEAVDPALGYPQDGNRLVQYLSWYSTSDNKDFNGYLYDYGAGNQLSSMGRNYATEAAKITDDLDFMPLSMAVESPIAVLDQATPKRALVSVSVKIANAGNNFYPQTVPVRLYDGHPNAGGAKLADGEVGVTGCGEEGVAILTFSLPWNGEGSLPGSLSLYVGVNPDGTLAEVNTNNNGLSHTVSLRGVPIVLLETGGYLPLVAR